MARSHVHLPEGFTLHAVTNGEVEAVADVLRSEELALRGYSDWGVEDTTHLWRFVNLDASWLVETADRLPAATVIGVNRGDDRQAWIVEHPDFAGRGLALALLVRTEENARAAGVRRLRLGVMVENEAARELFGRHGYREARHYYGMRIDLDPRPPALVWPAGIDVSTFRPEDARAFHEALGEFFEDEWGFHHAPFDEWKRERLEAPETDTSLWFIARKDDEIVAVARCDPKHEGGGWIGALGVRKPWRRRGIGLALLQHVFLEFHRRGEAHVGLGVDTENPTGATRLYERAGMRVVNEDVVYEKELT